MAAGKGERMLCLTKNRSKALMNINGKSLILYTLEQIKGIIEHIYVTIGYRGNEVTDFISQYGEFRFINTNCKGNAWWIHHSDLKNTDEPILIFPCDIIAKIDIDFIYRNYQKAGFPSCLLVPVIPVNGIEGDYILGEYGKVTLLTRMKKSHIYCSGIQVINPYKINRIINAKTEDFNEIWNLLIEKKQLYYSDIYPHRWYSINTPEQLESAKKIVHP